MRAKTGHWGMPLIKEGEEAEVESGELVSATTGGSKTGLLGGSMRGAVPVGRNVI